MADRPPPHLRPTRQAGVPRPYLGHHGSSNLSHNSSTNSNNHNANHQGQVNGNGGQPQPLGQGGPPPAATTTTTATNGGGVRRNLFQSQLTRRPTPTSSTSAETLRLDVDVLSDTSDIVVRDKNGDFEIGDPPTPPLEDPDDVGLDEAQENERKLAMSIAEGQGSASSSKLLTVFIIRVMQRRDEGSQML